MPTIPVQVSAAEAEEIVCARLPVAGPVKARLLHHPYSGLVYRVEQSALGRRLTLHVHTLVDLCSGAAAVCTPWPQLMEDPGAESIQGPNPVLTSAAAEDQARQCVVRTLLHRRFSLRHPRIELVQQCSVMGKPNWLVTIEGNRHFGVLVDGLSGIYHTVPLPRPAADRAS